MDRDLRKRDNRGKQREHRGGRGGFRGKPRSRGGRVPLPGNEESFQPPDAEEHDAVIRRLTIEACSRAPPEVLTFPESDIDGLALAPILSKLSLEDQLSLDFLVEVPRLEKQIQAISVPIEKPAPVVANPLPAEEDLDAWLTGLL
jgi:hypothetical protein